MKITTNYLIINLLTQKTANNLQDEKSYIFTFLATIFFRQYKLTSSLCEYLKEVNWLDPDVIKLRKCHKLSF
jgi:hypothetical protein